MTWAKGRFPALHSQSVQQIIMDFCDAITSTTALRKGHPEARYPWRQPKYHDVIYTNQSARIRNGFLLLPNGKAGTLAVRMPRKLTLPGRLMEVRLCFGKVTLICCIPDEVRPEGVEIGVDLGVNTLMAATDGTRAVLVSGRGVKATVQWRNKKLASLSANQSSLRKGSRRWKRTQRRKHSMLGKAHRRVRDSVHKATRLIANEFPNAKAYVGKPFNDAAQRLRRVQAQQVSQACNARIIAQLQYKLSEATEVSEHFSSQTCPVCGCRQKCRRIYRCRQCGYAAPRDVVGSTNILCIGRAGEILPGQKTPNTVKYLRPRCRNSSGGHPASSSLIGARIHASGNVMRFQAHEPLLSGPAEPATAAPDHSEPL